MFLNSHLPGMRAEVGLSERALPAIHRFLSGSGAFGKDARALQSHFILVFLTQTAF